MDALLVIASFAIFILIFFIVPIKFAARYMIGHDVSLASSTVAVVLGTVLAFCGLWLGASFLSVFVGLVLAFFGFSYSIKIVMGSTYTAAIGTSILGMILQFAFFTAVYSFNLFNARNSEKINEVLNSLNVFM